MIVSNLLYPSITLCVRPNASMIEKETEEYENKFPVPKKIGDMLNSFKYSVVDENMYDNIYSVIIYIYLKVR